MPRLLIPCVLLLSLSACAGGGGRLAYGPGRTDYPRPGPPSDPWRPYIRDAADRFRLPEHWIRAVMQHESGGHEYRHGRPLRSPAGAMGLMQLMPATYADMEQLYGLGHDPFEPHDNILAGSGYIRLLYGRYGAPAFLAAYNAGPQRLDDYLGSRRPLPNETVQYVAALAPRLGPEHAPAPAAAYAEAAPAVHLASYRVSDAPWAVQVGAFRSPAEAHFAANMARQAARAQLAASQGLLQPTSRDGAVLYRARLSGLTREDAGAACATLRQHDMACMVVAPGG